MRESVCKSMSCSHTESDHWEHGCHKCECRKDARDVVADERDELLDMLEQVTWQAAGMGDRVSSWNISAYEDAIEMLKEYGRLTESPMEHQYIRVAKL